MAFAHLHVHTEFSFLDGACKINALLERAKELNMTAMAITDHGGMYGIIDFYKKAKELGIKPIIGCEVYTAMRDMHDYTFERENRTGHLILLAKNRTGYENLIKIVSKGFTEGFYYKPRVDLTLLKKHSEGLVCLSACLAGNIAHAIANDDCSLAEKEIETYIDLYGRENFFLEIQDHGIPEQKKVNARLFEYSKKYNIGLVATNDVHYIKREDAKYQDLLMCIQTNKKVADTDRMRFEADEFYLKSEQEMEALFSIHRDSLENTMKIAQMCNVEFEFGNLKLPKYPVPDDQNAYSYLSKLCENGLEKRYGKNNEAAKKRLEYELGVIKSMGYVDYFLIVWDFINYARRIGVPIGPGRGSAAGSIVSFCLEITSIDPLRFGLLFERFLNPERISMPDIDVDISNDGRQKVIDYVKRKYGEDRVVQIITFNQMKSKAAIRDVGRVLDISYADTDRIAKMIPKDPKITIDAALVQNSELKTAYETEAEVKELIDDAKALEGLTRNAGTHAAGVVISKTPVTDYVPVQTNDDIVTTQFPMGTVEQLGLLKMDFLGLRNLSIIKDAVDIIKASTGEEIDTDNLDMNRKEVYEMISRGETEGVFQLESAGMRQFMKELKPSSIEDIIAGISLYRPGPMDQIPRYIKNKNNPSNIKYAHPMLEPILNVSYGCMVYQEQVMQIVRELAGYSLGRADLVRRAMSKKKADVMTEERKHFIYGKTAEDGTIEIEGAVKRGVPEGVANSIFDEMMDFANYAFNKSHAAAYAVVAYQTAYLKCFYPSQYLAALLSSVLDDQTKVSDYTVVCQRTGIKILPPDINESCAGFTVSNGDIRFGLAVIKNIGVGCVEEIVKERNLNGNYKGFDDFAKRTAGLNVSKRVCENLIKSGAFDTLGTNRASLLACYESIINAEQADKKNNIVGQFSLLDEPGAAASTMVSYPNLSEFEPKLLLLMEKECIGFYVSGHPMSRYRELAERKSSIFAKDLAKFAEDDGEADEEGEARDFIYDGAVHTVCGIISSISIKATRNNQQMAFVDIEDLTGKLEIIVFPKTYQRYRSLIKEDNLVIVSGKLSVREEEQPKILADKMALLEDEELEPTGKLYIRLELGKEYLADRIKGVLKSHSGQTPVYLHFEENKKTALAQRELWVTADTTCLDELIYLVGKENVVLRV